MPPNNPHTIPISLPLFFLVPSPSPPPPLIWSELGRGSWAGEVGKLRLSAQGACPFRWGGKE